MRGRERPWTVLVGLAALHVSVQRQGMSVSAFGGTSSPLHVLIERGTGNRPTISNKIHGRSIRNGNDLASISSWRGQAASAGPAASAATRPSLSTLYVSADVDADIIDNSKTDEDETEMAKEQRRRQLSQPPPQSKLRQLKDRMWVREALEDLTAADFAASLEQAAAAAAEAAAADEADKDEVARRKKKNEKRAVDVENILSKLDRRVEEMCVLSTYGDTSGSTLACYPMDSMEAASPLTMEEGNKCYALKQGEGMGSVVYTDEQRDALLTRIFASRQRLLKVMGVGGADANGNVEPEESAEDLDEIRQKLKANTTESDGTDVSPPITKTVDEKKTLLDIDPKLYVRDDGTIDWDGALQDSAALKKFGSSVWARINGQDPENIDEEAVQKEGGGHGGHGGESKAITVKIVETDEIREKKTKLDELQKELRVMTKEHRALLNSAVDAGSAVANVNLASLDPVLRSEIRTSAEALEKKEELVSCQVLIYELERIFTYLEGELGNTVNKGYIPLQDRLNVAEFGLLEAQISSFEKQLENGEYVDADVLAVVLDQVIDFKRRLGIDYYVTGLTLDKEAIQRFLIDLWEKTKTGLLFYVKGVELLWNDLIYSLRLIGRALQGYTLQPREVRTLRRSFKDIITFIPVVIILLIPLTPIGHVLVFGAIQRVFPDFFPSCFTETRQNLLELYESTEYTEVVIKETWQEQVTRALQAGLFNIGDAAKTFVGGESVDESQADDDTSKAKSSEKKI